MPEFPEWVSERQGGLEDILLTLLVARDYPFDECLEKQLPTKPGLYAISRKNGGPGEYLHAGMAASKTGLQGRVWGQHYKIGGAASDLIENVKKRRKTDPPAARQWIRENCRVRWVEVEGPELLLWAEDYILSVLQPKWEGVLP